MKKRLHTADHILCSVLEDYGAKPGIVSFSADSGRISFVSKKDLRELKDEIESKVNVIIDKNLEVINYKSSRKEAEKFTDLSMVPKDIKEVTIYEIKDFNKVACAGPHVKNTKDIGLFSIIDIKKKGKDTYSIKYSVGNNMLVTKKSKKIELQNAKGTRDIFPEDKILKQEVVNTLKFVFELYGFSPLETPILEKLDLLSAKYAGGAEILKETFTLKDQGGRQLGLRYDLTVPFARFVGMNPNMKMPFKRYAIGRVFRDGPIKLGRYREFWQCDVDIVGCKSMKADAEILLLVGDIFKKLGFDIVTKVNNRKLLDSIMDYSGVSKSKRIDAILAIDKLAKFGVDEVKKELREKGISDDSIKKILKLISVSGNNNQKIKLLSELENKEGLEEIKELLKYIKDVDFDPSLARGLSYYTGSVFEVFLKNSKITSALAGGGRYDNMIKDFLETDREYPTVGISFGLEVILDALKLRSKLEKKIVTQVYVIPIGTFEKSLKIAQQLRKEGIKTDIDLVGRGPSKNLNFVNSNSIPFALLIGEDELKQKKVMLKDMKTGKEQLIDFKKAIEIIKSK